MQVSEILEETKVLLSLEDHWAKSAYAPKDKVCIMEAVGKVAKEFDDFEKVRALLRATVRERHGERFTIDALGGGRLTLVTQWNDHQDTSFEDLHAVLDSALEKARRA